MRKVTYSRRSTHAARAAHARGEKEFRTYDTSAIRPQKNNKPFILAGIAILTLIIIAVAVNVSGCAEKNDHLAEPGVEVQVEIPEGSSVSTVADTLYDAGLIENRNAFKSAVSAQGADGSLHSGVYTFTGGMSNEELVEKLVSGTGASNLVVTEGQTIDTIATSVEKAYQGSISAKDFKAAATQADAYVDEFPFVKDAYEGSLEGFLFPKTYDLITNATAADVIKQMLKQYQKEVATLDYSYPESQGLDAYKTLILASIVEKEATAETMPKVAAVFYNRLSTKGDPSYGTLGSDATTVYEIGDNLEDYDWTTESPYNTRVTKGLPPSPICSPSLAALEAVCSPEPNFEDYYFFSFWPNEKGEVQYFFDKTYEDHQETIKQHS